MARNRLKCAGIALSLIPLGIAWRLLPLHLPFFLYKYGGSVLWAAMVYWIVAALLPAWPPVRLALGAGVVATAVELSRLLHTPALDFFRSTLAGQLLLGKYFSVRNIVAYWLAIGLAATADSTWFSVKRATCSGMPFWRTPV